MRVWGAREFPRWSTVPYWRALIVLLLGAVPLQGDESNHEPDALGVPYAFYNENFGFAVGYAYGRTRFPQPQASALGTIMAGTNESLMAFGLLGNVQVPGTERLFLDAAGSAGIFGEIDSYIDGNPDFTDERAGSNDSDEDNFLSGDGVDIYAQLRFRYLLPIGHGADHIVHPYNVEDGFLTANGSGGTGWHPFESGRSYILFEPFYRYQDFDADEGQVELITNGILAGLFWDNRDFPIDPSCGNSLRVRWQQDFGWFGSSDDWTNFQVEYDHYFDLGDTSWFQRQVLALNFWTSVSPSWDEQDDGSVDNRPPPYAGSRLGGLWRMRGYPSSRFNDKAAIYYAAELRLTPHLNPFDYWPWLQERVGIDWVQFVPFIEAGRVAPSWQLEELHDDMKYSAGVGFRFFAEGFVLRIDTAVSEEDVGIQMMVGQPFQF